MKRLWLLAALVIFGSVAMSQAVVPSEISGLPMIRETPDWAGGVFLLRTDQATGEVSFCVRGDICGYGYVMVVPCENNGVVDVYKIYCGGYVGPGRHKVYVNIKQAYAVVVVVVSSPLFETRCSIWPWWCGSRRYPGELVVLRPISLAGAVKRLVCSPPICYPPCFFCCP